VVVTEHAKEALAARVFAVPALAPYFHSAYGWGIAVAFQIVGFDGSLVRHLLPALLGPALAMLWDPPIRLLVHYLGASPAAAAAAVMLSSFLIALLAGPALETRVQRDPLLLLAPAANTLFFLYQALGGRGASVLPGDLKLLVAAVGVVALLAYTRAAGLLGNTLPLPQPPSDDKKPKHA
jgi:hypothetical protein